MYPIALTSMPHHGPGSTVSGPTVLGPALSSLNHITTSESSSSLSSCSASPLISGQSSPIHSGHHYGQSLTVCLPPHTVKRNGLSTYCHSSSSVSTSSSSSSSTTASCVSSSSTAAIASIEILLEPIRYSMTFLTLFSILSTIVVAILLAPFGRLQLLAQFVSLLVSLSGLLGITRRSILLSSVYALSMLLFLFLQCSYFFVLLKLVQEVNLSTNSNNHHHQGSAGNHHSKTNAVNIIYLDTLPPAANAGSRSPDQLPESAHHHPHSSQLGSQSSRDSAATSAIITTINSPSTSNSSSLNSITRWSPEDPALISANLTTATTATNSTTPTTTTPNATVADTNFALLLLSNPAYLPPSLSPPAPNLTETNSNQNYHPPNQPSKLFKSSNSKEIVPSIDPQLKMIDDSRGQSPGLTSTLTTSSSSTFTHVRHISIVLHEELTYLSLLTVPMLAWLPPSLFMETAAVLLLSMQALAAACFLYVLRIHNSIVIPRMARIRQSHSDGSTSITTTTTTTPTTTTKNNSSSRSSSSNKSSRSNSNNTISSAISSLQSETDPLIISSHHPTSSIASTSYSSTSPLLILPPSGAVNSQYHHHQLSTSVSSSSSSSSSVSNHIKNSKMKLSNFDDLENVEIDNDYCNDLDNDVEDLDDEDEDEDEDDDVVDEEEEEEEEVDDDFDYIDEIEIEYSPPQIYHSPNHGYPGFGEYSGYRQPQPTLHTPHLYSSTFQHDHQVNHQRPTQLKQQFHQQHNHFQINLHHHHSLQSNYLNST